MKMVRAFLSNHVLANLTFGLVILLGIITYQQLPREQDPTINFNWIQITTLYPGASASDIETRITEPLEDNIQRVSDIRFVSSNSRDSVSSILVRFNDISKDEFDKRLNDLRREVQNTERKLPKEAERPEILELTSSNAFPAATIAIVGKDYDESLRFFAKNVRKDLERINGVDRVDTIGLSDPELQGLFDPQKAALYNLSPEDIANTVALTYQDQSAGTLEVGDSRWVIRWLGADASPGYLATLPVIKSPELAIDEIASTRRNREKPANLVRYQNQDAIILTVMKKDSTNVLELVDKLQAYINEANTAQTSSGMSLVLLDDQTEITKNALNIMQTNALFGLVLVLFSTWLFLGLRIATIVAIGIPFTLCATFLTLEQLGQTLNVSVLLGVVICLGMLVDDSVVVVEAIYYRLARGMSKMDATIEGLKEVFAPVTASVCTTIAAFLPLMLLPGILGKFMLVIPLVVCLSLAYSLIEAYWMLPAHINGMKMDFSKPSKVQQLRTRFTRQVRTKYAKFLIKVLRRPKTTLCAIGLIFFIAIGSLGMGLIKFNFFASDPVRLFYVNVEMPPGTPVATTLTTTEQIESRLKVHLKDEEVRTITSYAGMMMTETEPFIGEQYGQILVSLTPRVGSMRTVQQIIETTRPYVENSVGPKKVSYLSISGGPPTTSPINIKVRGDNFTDIRKAVDDLESLLESTTGVMDITNDDTKGQPELVIRPAHARINDAGLTPEAVKRTVRLLVDGEIVSLMQDQGEELKVRIRSDRTQFQDIDEFLNQSIATAQGPVRLNELVHVEYAQGQTNIRHYNFRKAITINADIDKTLIDTVQANNLVKDSWRDDLSSKNPTVSLEFSGELDDIEESIGAMPRLFLIGLGIMYLILGTQFRSYWQPLMILITVPLAFCGVVFGLIVTQNPMSLFTLYGVVALSGIAVNSAIVLISGANDRLRQGFSVLHATVFAAKRRVIPILITSTTTIAGLFSLATGLGGQSLLWGPVATAIVWGLVFSTCLTLLLVPLLYHLSMQPTKSKLLTLKWPVFNQKQAS